MLHINQFQRDFIFSADMHYKKKSFRHSNFTHDCTCVTGILDMKYQCEIQASHIIFPVYVVTRHVKHYKNKP